MTECPLLSPLVSLDVWQSLPLSSVVVDPSIRNFDVAHISTATTSNFSAARDLCLLGKGSYLPAPPRIGWLIGMGPHTVQLKSQASESWGAWKEGIHLGGRPWMGSPLWSPHSLAGLVHSQGLQGQPENALF